MALTVNTLLAQREASSAGAPMKSDRRLWLTAANDEVVEDGDVRAAFLFASLGGEIILADVQRYGLVMENGRVVLLGSGPHAA